MSHPRRGEVWTIDLGTGRGSEQKGLRPVLIVQNDVGNLHAATTIVAAITSTVKSYPFTVPLRRGQGGLDRPSMVNLAQVFTVAKERLRKRLGMLPGEQMVRVNRALRISLGLD
ncbi:MAG: type II toxin-antitoxin system PemK/MazF family toxin [Deltaproteobacteria bacterium]|nr:MAG: type II toxin-antitoxin system PemK/MazF family toxin [Deltaproteobacteria bacterium]